ncbi:MAG TPA: GtrA family protein [Mycobacteriales bacterium]|nr:GtrA family protein [Mycobacteriales bacterium]
MVASWVRRMYETFEHLIHEIAKFGVIGAIAFALTSALSNAFHFGLNMGPLTSFGLATIIAAVLSYFANRHWTWKDRDQTGVRRELPLFLLLSAVGLVISELPVGFSEYVLGYHSPLAYNISSTLIGTLLGTVWRFWSFRRWVFRETSDPDPTDSAAHEALV